MIKVQYDSLTGAVIAAYDSPLEVSAPFVEVSESEWNAVAGRKVKVSCGILVCDLDAAKKEAARRLWENYKSFQTQYVDAEDLTLAVVCANGGSAKGKAVMMWVMNIWFVYYCFTAPIGFSLYYGTSNICQIVQSFITYKIYSPEKFKAEYEAELAAKKAAKKAKKTVTVQENGKEVTKEVNMTELNKMRLEYARQQDAELYKDERTTPLKKED